MTNQDLENRIVLITGASHGIGKATAEYLSSKGLKVYGATRTPDKHPDLPYHTVPLDLIDTESIKKCVDTVIKKEGRIDILINNAGYGMCGSLANITDEQLQKQFDINFIGTHRMTRQVLPHMKKQGHGRIINIGSVGGEVPLPGQGAYSASKAALGNATLVLRMEHYNTGIKVSLLAAGDVNTNFHQRRQYAQGYENDPLAQRAVELMHKSEMKGSSPLKVAEKIYKIIQSKNPKARYIVGKNSFLATLLQRLPTGLQERILRKEYGIKGRVKEKT